MPRTNTSVCNRFSTSPTAALNATKDQITHAERAIAGILNRYYVYSRLGV